LIEYTQSRHGTIKKKKVWDGVTGTVFNMPTKPLEPEPEPEDPKLQRTKALYSDRFRDGKLDPGPIFPLDIRRIEKVNPLNPAKVTPLLEAGEITVMDRDRPSNVNYRPMEKGDPWFIIEKQKRLRDNPLRQWPPGEDKNGQYLPTDDTIWREEYTKDQNFEARYFVTNLHGGTLVINGQQVRKGAIAGPLPSFAVIESPGGQVSFWWGIDGRNWGVSDPEKIQDFSRKWATMRMQEDWKHVAMPAGDVWNLKIADRVRRERRGNDENDDPEWKLWKNTKKAEDKVENPGSEYFSAYNKQHKR
jgi:hypothetical protein